MRLPVIIVPARAYTLQYNVLWRWSIARLARKHDLLKAFVAQEFELSLKKCCQPSVCGRKEYLLAFTHCQIAQIVEEG